MHIVRVMERAENEMQHWFTDMLLMLYFMRRLKSKNDLQSPTFAEWKSQWWESKSFYWKAKRELLRAEQYADL